MEEFRGGAGPSGKSTHPNYNKKLQDIEKRWWEKPLGIVALGILVTVIGGLILWGVTRHYDKPTPSAAAAQPTSPPQPQAAQPESKPQENTQPPSTHQRSGTEKKVKIEQYGEGSGAVGGSITTGPCSNVQVGGHGNQAAVNCDTSRRLSQQQIASIKSSAQNVCATLPLINVTASNGDQEAQRYAYDFVEALRSGGCKSDLALPIPGLTPDVSGIHIAVRDFNNIDSSARALGKILSDAGLSFSFNPMKPDFFPAEMFVLAIGAKD